MKCPNCHHNSDTALLKCSACAHVYDRAALEKFEHLQYLLAWLAERQQAGALQGDLYTSLHGLAAQQLESVQAAWRVPPASEATPVIVGDAVQPAASSPNAAPAPNAPDLALLGLVSAARQRLAAWEAANLLGADSTEKLNVHLKEQARQLRLALSDQTKEADRPNEAQLTAYVVEAAADWHRQGLLTLSELRALRRLATEPPIPTQAVTPPAAPAQPQRPPAATPQRAPQVAPVAPPKPPRPPINWSGVWDKVWSLVISGALLRGLLYLGAFMIVVSAVVLVVAYWQSFAWPVQIGFIAAVPLAFYAGGFFLRSRLKIPVAGGVFTGIGAVLVAVDFAAVYQLGGLHQVVDVRNYWLIASLVCSAVYVFTTWRVRGEFFVYLTLLTLTNSVIAFTTVLNAPLEWRIASATAAATGMVGVAAGLQGRLSSAWDETLAATRRLPYLLIPLSLFLVVLVPGQPAWGQMAAWLCAAVAYGVLAWRFPSSFFAQAASWSLVGALGFGLRAVVLPWQWFATAAAVVAPLYLSAGQWLKQRMGQAKTPFQQYPVALHLVGFVLLGVAVAAGLVGGVADVWASVAALALASAVLAGCAYLFHRPLFVAMAGFLFIVPVSLTTLHQLAAAEVNQPFAWLMLVWGGLALAYIATAAALRRAERYGVWLHVQAQALPVVGLLGLLLNFVVTRTTWSNVPTLAALAAFEAVYLASAFLHARGRQPALARLTGWLPALFRPGIFLWPAAGLIPVWLAVAWWGSVLPHAWLGAALAALALLYAGVGQLLGQRQPGYRLPVHFYSNVLIPYAIGLAWEARLPLMTSLYLAVAVLGLLAVFHRSSISAALASALFLAPVYISLQLLNVLPHAFSLVFSLLAALGYIPLGVWLRARGRAFALPHYVLGQALALITLFASLGGRFAFYSVNLPWVGVAVPLVVTGQQIFSLYRFRRVLFGWAAVAVFAIGFGQFLTLIALRPDYDSVAWVGLAFAYLLAERGLAWSSGNPRLGRFTAGLQLLRRALTFAVLVLAGLGLALTLPDTLKAFVGLAVLNYFALILAQTVAFLLVVAAARLHHRRWPLFIAPSLTFAALTLIFIGYPYSLTGRALTAPEFGLVWSGLGLAYLVAGFLLDRNRVRYSHALYLGGYGLFGWSLIWSIPDRLISTLVLALAVVAALASHVLLHFNRHQTFDDFMNLFWKRPGTVAQRAVRTGFLFFAAYGLVVCLAETLTYNRVPLAWQGLGLALVAPIYIAVGLAVRRFKPEYTWPFYSAGFALTAIGAMLAFENETLAFYVLALDTVVYAASAYIFRQAFWLYLSNALVPVLILLALHLNQSLTSTWVAVSFMGLAFAYFGLGQWFNRGRASAAGRRASVKNFALAFWVPAYLLSALALAVASSDKSLAIAIYSAGVGLYALSAWVHRKPVFLYPAVWLSAVPYYLLMTLTALPPAWYGLGWLPLIVGLILLGKFVFHKRPLSGCWAAPRTIGEGKVSQAEPAGAFAFFTHPALPFYLLAYTLSVSMLVLSQTTALTFTVALGAATLLYVASAILFRRAAWLFPGLFTLHFGVLTSLAIYPSDKPAQYVALPFLGLTWLVALAGYGVSRWLPSARPSTSGPNVFRVGRRELSFGNLPVFGHLLTPSWSQPFFIFTALDVLGWQLLALGRYDTALIVALGFMLLLMLFATLWQDLALAYGALVFLTLAVGTRLAWAQLSFAEGAASLGGMGFALYLLARLLDWVSPLGKDHRLRLRIIRLWVAPLTNAAVLLTGLGVILTLPFIVAQTLTSAAALAFAGAFYLTLAFRGRYYRLGYAALAMLQLAWVLVLAYGSVREPQLYAIPAGLYFTGMGYLERRRSRGLFAIVIEVFGLAVLLLTSFIQSLKGGADGLPFFVLLLLEGLLVIAWGASRRLKLPFFIGLGASALNVAGQIVVLFNGGSTLARWTIIGSAGLLLVFAAVLVERQRALLLTKAQEWREALETWD